MNTRTSFAKRHPLGTFFILTFALTWAAMVLWLQGGGEAIPWFTFGPMLAQADAAVATHRLAVIRPTFSQKGLAP